VILGSNLDNTRRIDLDFLSAPIGLDVQTNACGVRGVIAPDVFDNPTHPAHPSLHLQLAPSQALGTQGLEPFGTNPITFENLACHGLFLLMVLVVTVGGVAALWWSCRRFLLLSRKVLVTGFLAPLIVEPVHVLLGVVRTVAWTHEGQLYICQTTATLPLRSELLH